MIGSDTTTGDAPVTEAQRSERLAMIGLATVLSSSALAHGLKGHLHNLALLVELLQKESASATDAGALRAIAAKRASMLRTEIEAMGQYVRLSSAIGGSSSVTEAGTCDVRSGLSELLPTARVEAVRRDVALRMDIEPAVERVDCSATDFQKLVLACVTHAIRHCAKRATLVVAARREDDRLRIEFIADAPLQPSHPVDDALLRMLAESCGARYGDEPAMSLTFGPRLASA